jgi:RNA polymerase sigma-70 factor, ECF subfamily
LQTAEASAHEGIANGHFSKPVKYFVTFLLFHNSVGMGVRPTTFHELYDRYGGDVYRFAHWLTGNPHDASDITSETFVRAWTAPEEPRMETVKAYLFTIARNLHRNQWRRQSRFAALDEAMPDQAAQPDEAAINQDEFQRTLKAVHELPEIERTVLLLRAEQELSYEDIAAATGLSAVAVRVRVFRARAKLAALLHPKKKEIL